MALQMIYNGQEVEVIRQGGKNTRVKFANGQTILVGNDDLLPLGQSAVVAVPAMIAVALYEGKVVRVLEIVKYKTPEGRYDGRSYRIQHANGKIELLDKNDHGVSSYREVPMWNIPVGAPTCKHCVEGIAKTRHRYGFTTSEICEYCNGSEKEGVVDLKELRARQKEQRRWDREVRAEIMAEARMERECW